MTLMHLKLSHQQFLSPLALGMMIFAKCERQNRPLSKSFQELERQSALWKGRKNE